MRRYRLDCIDQIVSTGVRRLECVDYYCDQVRILGLRWQGFIKPPGASHFKAALIPALK